MTSYTRGFFDDIREGALRSAETVVPLVLSLVGARSVVDVGCGDGTWLSVFARQGVTDFLGLDGAYVDRRLLAIPPERFVEQDLARSFALGRTFDLAVSFEVGEHLPDSAADGFVASIVRLAPVVAFSAAVPHQTGEHHVNEQWPEYWAGKFERHGYAAADALRPALWDRDDVAWWYAQNAIVYARDEAFATHPALAEARRVTDSARLARVHPRNYARIGELLAEKERRRDRLSRRIGRLLRGKPAR